MRYRSRVVEVEAMRFHRAEHRRDASAHQIVEWVKANGGNANYNAAAGRIEVASNTISGFRCCYPGEYVVMDNGQFQLWDAVAFDGSWVLADD